jgi:hypothetical protein
MLAAAGTSKGEVVVWELPSKLVRCHFEVSNEGNPLMAMEGSGKITHVSFSKDCSKLLAMSYTRLYVWDVDSNTMGTRYVSTELSRSGEFNKAGDRVAFGTGNQVLVLSSVTAEMIFSFQDLGRTLSQFVFVENDSKLLTINYSGRVRAYNCHNGQECEHWSVNRRVNLIMFCPDETRCVLVFREVHDTAQTQFSIHEVITGAILWTFEMNRDNYCRRFLSYTELFLISSREWRAYILDYESGSEQNVAIPNSPLPQSCIFEANHFFTCSLLRDIIEIRSADPEKLGELVDTVNIDSAQARGGVCCLAACEASVVLM